MNDQDRTELGLGIEEGLREALAWKRGEITLETVDLAPMPPERIRAIYKSVARSAKEFERKFGIPAGTLNNWLQGRRSPDPASRAYLTVIAAAPETVANALRGKRGHA
jgi:putative transcriptional regulator